MDEQRIRSPDYTSEDLDCRYCLSYKKEKGCTVPRCPWIRERIRTGALTYRLALKMLFGADSKCAKRLDLIAGGYTGSLFCDKFHMDRMAAHVHAFELVNRKDNPSLFAALYLMTANKEIFFSTTACFNCTIIDFKKVDLREVSAHNYTLIIAAKQIYLRKRLISEAEMADEEIIDDLAFRLIANALLIRHYGEEAFFLQK